MNESINQSRTIMEKIFTYSRCTILYSKTNDIAPPNDMHGNNKTAIIELKATQHHNTISLDAIKRTATTLIINRTSGIILTYF